MPRVFTSSDRKELAQADADVLTAFEQSELDLRSLAAISSLCQVASAVRNHMESTVLAPAELSWSAFMVLFVVRVWGPQESNRLAIEAGITPGTLTGVVKTLESRGLVKRKAHATDGRRVVVALTAKGKRLIEKISPAFIAANSQATGALSIKEKDAMTASLRTVLRTVDNASK